MRLHDTPTGYGWISIVLHWLAAAAIVALLFVGDSIGTAGDHMLRLHTTIALTAYVVIAIRIWWRFKEGHPGPEEGQKGWSFTVGKVVHYILVVAMGVMLVSGPLQAWSGGMAVRLFDLEIPSPFGHSPALFEIAHEAHVWGAITLAVGTVLHIGGVFKHTIWNRDHTLIKIFMAAKPPEDSLEENPKPAAPTHRIDVARPAEKAPGE
jgi:cytochrome b561